MARTREWVLDQLLTSMADADPLESLIRRAGGICDASVVVVTERGEIARSVGSAPARLISGWLHESSEARGRIGRWALHRLDIRIRGQSYGLVVARVVSGSDDEASDSNELVRTVLECMGKLLRSFSSFNALAVSSRRTESEQLVRTLQQGISSAREPALWRAMEAMGFESWEPVRVARVVIRTEAARGMAPLAESSGEPWTALSGSTDAWSDGPVLTAETARSARDAEYTLVFAARLAIDQVLPVERAVGGVSEPFVALSRIPEMLTAADTAAAVAPARVRGNRLVAVDDMRPFEWAAARLRSQFDQTVVRRCLDRLRADPDVWETVAVHYGEGGTVSHTARRLRIHENTVRYRLAKLERMLGTPLSDPRTVADIVIALSAA